MTATVVISVWSDFVCPFCYLEKPVLDQLKATFGNEVEIDWRAFELRPEPVPLLDPDGEYLHTTWERYVYPMAEERFMTLRLPPVQPRSRLALEAERYARSVGLGEALQFALFQGFFEQGLDIGDIDMLLEIGASIGLNQDGLRVALESGEFTAAVQADQQLAQQLGIKGVPAMLLRRSDQSQQQAKLVSGAQPFPLLARLVEEMLSEVND